MEPDPRTKVDLAEQYELAIKVRDDVSTLSGVVQQLRAVRKQLADRNELLGEDKKYADIRKASKELIKKLSTLEEKLHNPKAKVVYDIFGPKGGAMLYSQLVFIYSTLQDGDGPPTQGVQNVYKDMSTRLSQLVEEFKTLTTKDLVQLNDDAKKLELPTVFVPAVKPNKKPPKGT
ncbi:MAG: hypothetical protein ACJ8LM_10995 [Candidatus Udaeobacter sp.]